MIDQPGTEYTKIFSGHSNTMDNDFTGGRIFKDFFWPRNKLIFTAVSNSIRYAEFFLFFFLLTMNYQYIQILRSSRL